MKAFIAILLIGSGLVAFFKILATSPSVEEVGGAFIGVLLFCGLPSYFLLRNKNKSGGKEWFDGDKK
ncbi:MAG: hypothetical protein II990_05560 [Muribaculaceae bacterium]|nr:hypothetical protein [Muribaculaceae bacterium]